MPISGMERAAAGGDGREGNLQIGHRRESSDTAGDGEAHTHTHTQKGTYIHVTHGASSLNRQIHEVVIASPRTVKTYCRLVLRQEMKA